MDNQTESAAIRDIREERARQISEEGWAPEHDDTHIDASLAAAAGCYALNAARPWGSDRDLPMEAWPWDRKWWKPGGSSPEGRRRDLIKAGALVVAEIERLDRAAEASEEGL